MLDRSKGATPWIDGPGLSAGRRGRRGADAAVAHAAEAAAAGAGRGSHRASRAGGAARAATRAAGALVAAFAEAAALQSSGSSRRLVAVVAVDPRVGAAKAARPAVLSINPKIAFVVAAVGRG